MIFTMALLFFCFADECKPKIFDNFLDLTRENALGAFLQCFAHTFEPGSGTVGRTYFIPIYCNYRILLFGRKLETRATRCFNHIASTCNSYTALPRPFFVTTPESPTVSKAINMSDSSSSFNGMGGCSKNRFFKC
eukprot:GEMP01098841.1.p1 GENE.GEMP01098841.1~~GEMP01098841.1.p1  ORF type:complete len:135 (-),score=1.30 GEMP01098841.1:52-456(-)